MIDVPAALRREWQSERSWLDSLPNVAAECAEAWGLSLERPVETPHSLVVPAGNVVLKVNAPSHFEAEHEPDALAHWDGRGAVRLVARNDARRAFLVERCRPGTCLSDAETDEVSVVGELLPRLWSQPADLHPFKSAADEARRWAKEMPARYDRGRRPFERSLVDLALDVFSTTGDAGESALVNQDLHAGNVLSAAREPWLVIDPKPLVGEREMNAVGLLRNAAWDGGTAAVGRWLDALAGIGLDRERSRGWGVAHALAWGWSDDGWSPRSVEAARRIAAA